MSGEPRCPRCEPGAESFSELLEGTLSAPQRDELERHLAGCADCRALLAALREQIEACRATPRPVPSPDCVARAVQTLQAELARRRAGPH